MNRKVIFFFIFDSCHQPKTVVQFLPVKNMTCTFQLLILYTIRIFSNLAITLPLTVAAGKKLHNLKVTIFLPSWSLVVVIFLLVLATLTLSILVLDAPTISIQFASFGPSMLVASLPTSIYILFYTLLLSFNRRQFYYLSDILAYICIYLIKQNYIYLYIDIVRQAIQIFHISVTFTSGLINNIKKNKSFEMKLQTKNQVNLLVAPIKYYIKAIKVEKF